MWKIEQQFVFKGEGAFDGKKYKHGDFYVNLKVNPKIYNEDQNVIW